MPRAPKKCGRFGCESRVTSTTYCDECKAKAETARPSRHERGYGTDHDRRVRALRQAAEASGHRCYLCLTPINYALKAPHPGSFAAHHLVQDRHGPLVPSHKLCNERAGQPAT